MSEPIPIDVMKAAKDVVDALPADCRDCYQEVSERIVARAILAERLAERERCAKLVDCNCSRYCDFKEAAERIRGAE